MTKRVFFYYLSQGIPEIYVCGKNAPTGAKTIARYEVKVYFSSLKEFPLYSCSRIACSIFSDGDYFKSHSG